MADDPFRLEFSASQVALFRQVLAGASPAVIDAGERMVQGEVVHRRDVEAVVEVLSAAWAAEDSAHGHTPREMQIDELIAIAYQRAHDFYD